MLLSDIGSNILGAPPLGKLLIFVIVNGLLVISLPTDGQGDAYSKFCCLHSTGNGFMAEALVRPGG